MSLTPAILLAAAVGLFATLACATALRWLAPILGLLDHPGGRKQHEHATPVVGGLAMACGVALAWVLVPESRPEPAWQAGFAAFVLVGAVDDRLQLQARSKFLFQALVAAAIVAAIDPVLSELGEVLPGWSLSLGWFSAPFTVLAIVSVINAINMSDGVDGLAGSLTLCAMLSLALACGLTGRIDTVLMAVLCAATLAGFLVFNIRGAGGRPARIFMGDAGSLGIGFLLAVVAIKAASGGRGGVPPAVVLWSCFVPLADGLSVILSRWGRRSGAMCPGRDHLHHLLLARGYGPLRVVLIEAGSGLALSVGAVLAWRAGLPDWVLVSAFVGGFFVLHVFLKRAWASTAGASMPGTRSADGLGEPRVAADRGGA